MRHLLALTACALFALGLGRDALDRWVARTNLPPLTVTQSVEVLDRNGQLLRAYTVADGRWRMGVRLDQVDPRFVQMLVRAEDKRFYDHAGIDPIAMVRATAQALRHGRIISGGSTLTMQVARLLEDGPTGRWGGKLRQIRLALALERRLSKAEILQIYLNRAPYGGNLEGVRAATRAYFGKDPKRLSAAEAALLVALPQSPETRRPDRFPDAAKTARDRVLTRLSGRAFADDALAPALRSPVPPHRKPVPALAAHMADRALREDPLAMRHSLTIDGDLQRRIEALAETAAREAGQRLSAAILVMDHRSGDVLASAGSARFAPGKRAGFVDMTRALRSPGSTLKPLVYGLAFDQGIAHPETLLEDRPTAFGGYAPQNFDGQFRGTIRARDALRLSLNIPVVALTEAIGPTALIAHLERAGAKPRVPGDVPGLAVSLGGVGVTMEDLVRLYGAIAANGRAVPMHWRAGAVPAAKGRVLNQTAAWYVADILREIPPPATAPLNGLAYKTGTSYGHRDAWAIGFDGAHVIGVWLGRPDGTPVPGVFGGQLAAPVLFEAFSRLKPRLDPLAAPPPGALVVETAQLPQPLRHFGTRGKGNIRQSTPKIAFPPDGATVETDGALFARVRDGKPPFTWLVDGAPALVGSRDAEVALDLPSQGYVRLSVIDADGNASRSTIFVSR